MDSRTSRVGAAVNGSTLSLTNPISQQADFERQNVRLPSRIVDPPDGLVPYQPWAAAKQKQQSIDYAWPTKPEHIDTQHRCLLSGVPRLYFIIPSFKIYEATIDDPAVFTRPWTIRVAERRRPDEKL